MSNPIWLVAPFQVFNGSFGPTFMVPQPILIIETFQTRPGMFPMASFEFFLIRAYSELPVVQLEVEISGLDFPIPPIHW